MEFRRLCDDPSNMTELAHNHVFIKNGEAWYRDFEREISVRDLMREICTKHASPADADEMDNETLDEVLMDNLQFGTDDLEGVLALLYMTLWGMADVRSWLEKHEKQTAGEQPDNCIYGYGVCCYPIEECESCPNRQHIKEAGADAAQGILLPAT